MSVKKSIGWCDITWNPIKGLCPVDCKLPDGRSYCYARKIYKRFKLNPELAHIQTTLPKKPAKVFVCSTIEIFHPAIPREWRDIIFNNIKAHPQHIFQVLTKFPQNIDRKLPDNCWIGVTVEGAGEIERTYKLNSIKAKTKFISFEPLLVFMSSEELDHIQLFDWIIVGRLTQHGKDYDPPKWWIGEIVNTCKRYNIPIFLKDNLKEIWGENLIQEFPK